MNKNVSYNDASARCNIVDIMRLGQLSAGKWEAREGRFSRKMFLVNWLHSVSCGTPVRFWVLVAMVRYDSGPW